MDDRIQVAEAKEDLQGIEAKPEVVVAYDVKTDTCTMKTVPNGAHASTDDTLEPMASVSEQQHNTVLLREGEKKSKFQYVCPSCYGFFKSYRSTDPQGKVTPFALVLLLVLFAVYVLNQADRLVLPVVIPAGLRCGATEAEECGNVSNLTNGTDASNRTEDCIAFSDHEQGIITGPAFTVIYVIAGLPLARLADTRSRSLVLLFGLTFWSAMVLLTGFVTRFWELLLLRVLLGVGEASCNPVAYSLIADMFPPQHRAFALSFYHYGVYLGGGLGWMIGAINDVLSWRWTFHILGIAGLCLVPLAALALWEPKEVKKKRKARRKGKASYSIKEVVVCLASMPSFWLLLAAGSIRNIPGYAIGAWLPTFYALEHDVRPSSYGVRVGLVIVFGGGLGSFLGGFLADRLSSRWKHGKAFVIAVSQLLAAPSIAAVLLVPSVEASYWLLFVAYFTAETWLGPAAAIVQDICMPAMRAQASAIYVGVITIVASVGPVIVPGLLDSIQSFDKCGKGVGYALLLTAPTLYVASAVLFALLGVVLHKWHRVQLDKKSGYATFDNEQSEDTVHSTAE